MYPIQQMIQFLTYFEWIHYWVIAEIVTAKVRKKWIDMHLYTTDPLFCNCNEHHSSMYNTALIQPKFLLNKIVFSF